KPGHLTSSDSALELDVPAGAVSAADVATAGGSMSLMGRQGLPASGGSAGGSGPFTFGTFLMQVLDADSRLAPQGLRQPPARKLQLGGRGVAVDVGHAFAVVNRPLPPWVDRDPASAGAPSTGARLMAASPPASRNLGRTTTRPATVDAGTGTLSTSALASGSS